MNTINGYLDVRIEGNNVVIRTHDCKIFSNSTAVLDRDSVKALRGTLKEALVRLDYPEQTKGLENDTLEQA